MSNIFSSELHNPELYLKIFCLIIIFLSLTNSKIKFSMIIRTVFIWLFIIFIFIAMYSYKYEIQNFFSRIIANIIPYRTYMNDDKSISIKISDNNHYMINAIVDGVEILFLIDTGATNTVLSLKDAKLIGADIDNLIYNIPVNTANGISFCASYKIDYIEIGDIKISDMSILISKNMDESLLGMSFLNRLKSFQFSDNVLTLYK